MKDPQQQHSVSEELLRQQTALARFGELTLRSEDLDEILQEATKLAAEGLRVDFAKILELQRDGRLLVRAGVGWRPGVVGHTVVDAGEGSVEALALATGEPLITADIHQEQRFRISEFVKEHGVRSFVNVNIIGAPGGPPYGILEVDMSEPRQFTADDADFLRTYANLVAAAVQRMGLIDQLRQRADEKDKLLQELQHRVKNNLQMITSLIRLQANATGSDEVRHELNKISDRINTLRIVYERLHASGETDLIELGSYLADLSNSLLKFHQAGEVSVRLITDMERLIVPPQTAVPLALVTNEFITNSLKYAFPDGTGTIGIRLERVAQGGARLTLWDNGRGLPEVAQSGTGLRLIEALARQVASEVHWTGDPGTQLSLKVRPPHLS